MIFEETPLPLGLVPVEGRGDLPFSLVRGESLVACASWALTEAGVELFDYNVPWEQVRSSGRPLVVHDPLCPLTPVDFVREAVDRCVADGAAVVAVRPVTDTLKEPVDGDLGGTVDRSAMLQVTSPVVLAAEDVAALSEAPVGALADLARALVELEGRPEPVLLPAPELSCRVGVAEDLKTLEALAAG